ncbi:hypothetical protein [Streptomyces sp. NPDC085466]|uniref:hypothetical protein n=1 Tax=Streptomyces sp. NPDC085466 TaxID=3365725 RepID=UPI0037D80BD8
MKHPRTSAPRVLSAAVTVVLAVTAGALTSPVFAAPDSPVTAPAATEQELPLLKDDSRLTGAGPSGFLSWHGGSGSPITYAWTRYADGATRELPTQMGLLQTAGTDLLTEPVLGAAHTVFDMATGAPPVVLDLSTLGEGFQRGLAVGPASVLVRGGAFTGGEGMYRIASGPDGVPKVRQVASTGRPTALTLLSADVPAVMDFDKQNPATLAWRLSTANASTTVTLTHVATGRTVLLNLYSSAGTKKDTWNGEFDNGIAAYNGAWTWRLTAKPSNGIGPAIDETGTFRVQRAAVPHDFDDNGLPDVLGLSENGTFERHTVVDAATDWYAEYAQSTVLGTGWNVYDRIVPTANLGGAAHADILTRDRTGVLWLHQGNGTKLDHRVRIGGGWQDFTQIIGVGDQDRDGRGDLMAVHEQTGPTLYRGTGDWKKPLAARQHMFDYHLPWGIYY